MTNAGYSDCRGPQAAAIAKCRSAAKCGQIYDGRESNREPRGSTQWSY